MSFDKNYPNRKDHRRDYYHLRQRMFRSCRPGGDCPWCERNRRYQFLKQQARAKDLEHEGTRSSADSLGARPPRSRHRTQILNPRRFAIESSATDPQLSGVGRHKEVPDQSKPRVQIHDPCLAKFVDQHHDRPIAVGAICRCRSWKSNAISRKATGGWQIANFVTDRSAESFEKVACRVNAES